MRQALRNWIWTVIAIFILYVGVSTVFFNYATHAILGMPPMLFWFTLMPLATPLLLGWLYHADKHTNPQWDEQEET